MSGVSITGGAGFIGANLCRALRSADPGRRIVVVDDLSSGSKENLHGVEDVELVQASILEQSALYEAVAGTDTIVHLAARPSVQRSLDDPLASNEVNVTGTLRVLEAARRAGNVHVIVASSSSVYGAQRALPAREDAAPSPLSPYGASKLAAESYALAYGRSFGLPVLAFRFFNVFGPLQSAGHAYAAVVPTFLSAALNGQPLPIHGDGHQTRDFTYVGSVVSVLRTAVDQRVSYPGPVNLAFGGRHSILELAALLEQILGRELERAHGPARPGDVRDSQADQGRLRELFPAIEPVNLAEGLRATVEWFRSSAA